MNDNPIQITFPDHETLVKFVYNARVNSSADGRRVLLNVYPGLPLKAAEAAAFEAAARLGVTTHT